MAKTYATWNPLDKSSDITLSNGNLTATTAAGWRMARATQSKTSGKWYYEVTTNVLAGANGCFCGVSNSSASLSAHLGVDANGWGFYQFTGRKYNNGDTAYSTGWGSLITVGVAFDMGAGTIEFFKNGVSAGVAFTNLTGALFPTTALFSGGNNMTANFGATPFTYSPPAGYNAGVYTGEDDVVVRAAGVRKSKPPKLIVRLSDVTNREDTAQFLKEQLRLKHLHDGELADTSAADEEKKKRKEASAQRRREAKMRADAAREAFEAERIAMDEKQSRIARLNNANTRVLMMLAAGAV